MNNHPESPGERAVKAELEHLGIRYIQEHKIFGLRGDTKAYREADFYLPDYDIYIEYLGEYYKNKKNGDKRYGHKMRVYENNNIKCIYIYPNQLNYSQKVIKEGIERYGDNAFDQLRRYRGVDYAVTGGGGLHYVLRYI